MIYIDELTEAQGMTTRVLWEGERGAEVAKAYPLNRLGEPEDIAEAALYFSDDSASGWVTGQTLILDGGGSIGFNRVG